MLRLGLKRPHIPPGNRLDGVRVYLRPPRIRDFRRWARLRAASRDFLTPWEPTWSDQELTRAAFHRRLRRVAHEWHDDTAYSFFIFRRHDRRMLGGITLSRVQRGVAQMGSLGYWIGAPFARKGYMYEAVTTLLPFAFQRMELHRIEAACLPHNDASRQLLLKLGFQPEGRARAYLKIDGTWQDHLLFALLSTDPWQTAQHDTDAAESENLEYLRVSRLAR